MKLLILCLVLTLSAVSAYSQIGDNYIKLSHDITKENKNITGFQKIEVSEDFEVYLSFSETSEEVVIESNENLHDRIIVEKEGDKLKISTKPYSYSYNNRKKDSGAKEKLVAYITAKKLTEIKGTEDVTFLLKDKLYADNLTIDLDEDTSLKGYIEAQHLVVLLNEDSTVYLKGGAKSMKVDADEDSIIAGYDFVVGDIDINLNEDSVAKLTVNGEINLRAKEDSYFYHKGDGHFNRKHLSGDSEVR
jgi:hypothetical protein